MSFIWIVKVLVQDLGHLKHVNFVLFEYRPHGVVASDVAPVPRILEVMCTDILPESFDRLGPGQLKQVSGLQSADFG